MNSRRLTCMLGGVLDDAEALEALEQTVYRMRDVHQRFCSGDNQLNCSQKLLQLTKL